jgi:N-acetylneuraminic acid mutarotase
MIAFTVSACASAQPPDIRPGVWDAAPPMLHARSAHNVVAYEGGIIALAGSGTGGATVAAVEHFDGSTWRTITTLPGSGLNAPASAVVGNRIYVIGGFNGVSNVPTSDVHIYDIATRAWSRAAPLPAPRGGHAAVVLDGRIHVFGGGNSQSTIADHSMYDPSTNAWTELAPLPFSRGSPAGVVYNQRIFSIGGRSGPSDFGDVVVYNPGTNTWTSDGAIEPVGTAGAVVYNGTIYLFGGESQARRESVRTVLRYDGATRTWQEDTPMPTGRNYARAVVFRDNVYLVGGNAAGPASHGATGSTIVERFRVQR